MLQVFQQSYMSKELCVEEVPAPLLRGTGVLVQTAASLISPGTERAMVSFAKKGLIAKILSQPERVQLLMRKVKQIGLVDTFQFAQRKLANPVPLGYSTSGLVLEASSDMPGVKPGDRVACAGAQCAKHAEVLYIPKNLCVPLPDNVSFEEGSFVALGAIALHAVRIAQIGLGETILIIGLGLVGQLTTQLVKAQGGIPIGIDLDDSRLKLGQELGLEHALHRYHGSLNDTIASLTHGKGVDIVMITAATPSHDPIILAGELCRERGKVVVVGEVSMNVPRSVYYRKELSVLISRSYGPGRYDEQYEEKGRDYPVSYVRWTERDNMSTFLQLVSNGSVNLKPLIDHRIPIEEAAKAYDMLTDPKLVRQPLGIVLTYSQRDAIDSASPTRQLWFQPNKIKTPQTLGLSVIGSGNFFTGTILPILKTLPDTQLRGLVSNSGLSARNAATQGNFAYCSTDAENIWQDEDSPCVIIATRHDSHAPLVRQALNQGKHVFVEKPLAVDRDGLRACAHASLAHPALQLMVGYNRRFAPLSISLKKTLRKTLGKSTPLSIRYRVLAGSVPDDSWLHQDGGRIIGEGCHFVDWCQFITDEKPSRVSAMYSGEGLNPDISIQLEFSGGSTVQIIYCMRADAATAAAIGKENIEISAPGLWAELHDFKTLTLTQKGKVKTEKLSRQDKGHSAEFSAWTQSLKQGIPAIALESLLLTTETTFAIMDALQSRQTVEIRLEHYFT